MAEHSFRSASIQLASRTATLTRPDRLGYSTFSNVFWHILSKTHTSTMDHARQPLSRLRFRPDTLYLSRGRTVFATNRDGFVDNGPGHGLFVHETRLLSRYVLRVDGRL